MYQFSTQSTTRLKSCHSKLQTLFNEVIKHIDCTILEGVRDETRQARLLNQGRSQVKHSKHQDRLAVDVAPCPIHWDDSNRFYYFAGFVLGIASQMNISLRWGGDWNKNHQFDDQNFDDLVHFELYNH